MNIAVFGASGFVGNYILDELDNNNHTSQILIRRGSESKISPSEKQKIIIGDISDTNAIIDTIKDADAIIYNIGIIREFKNIYFDDMQHKGVERVVKEAKKMNIKRFILMSANGVKENGTGYQHTKFLAEEYLKQSGLNYTIFRPSLIFGPSKAEDQEFCTQLRDTMIKLPIPAPLFFSHFNIFKAGNFKMSPIHIENVAEFFIKSIENSKHYMKTYNLGGLQSYNWKQIISNISLALRKKKWMIPAPVEFIKVVAFFFDRFKFFPITRDQITMLLEGNTCNSDELFKDFNITPIDFSVDSLSYLRDK